MKIEQHLSPNFGPRAAGKDILHLVLHYTDTLTTEQALHILQSEERQVSAHYLIGEDGRIIQLVDEKNRAWHAGKSFWAGETDINSTSIGIEIQNPGHSYGYVPFPQVQMDAVLALGRDIARRHLIAPQHVLAHSDIAPARKKDPGELFPWQWLADNGLGLWPADAAEERLAPHIEPLLHAYGYDPTLPLETVVTAFQRHFEPEAFTDGTLGQVTERMQRRLQGLLDKE